MSSDATAEPTPIRNEDDPVWRRGRTVIRAIIALLAFSMLAAFAARIAVRGTAAMPRSIASVLIGAVLLWFLDRGSQIARWLTVALLALLAAATVGGVVVDSTAAPWLRVGFAVVALTYAASCIALVRLPAVRVYFLYRWIKREFPGAPLDGVRRHAGKTLNEWIPFAAAPDPATRREAAAALGYLLEDDDSSIGERALLSLIRDSDREVGDAALYALNYGRATKLIRHERAYAIEIFRAVRAEPLSADARRFLEAQTESEDPDLIRERLDHDDHRIEAASDEVHRFESAGNILRDLSAEF